MTNPRASIKILGFAKGDRERAKKAKINFS